MSWLNSPALWATNIPSPVNSVDLAKFQGHLDEIVGVDPDGTKRWRVIWGMNGDASREWDRYARAWIPRYRSKSYLSPVVNPATGIIEQRTEFIGVPRYFVEALVPRFNPDSLPERAGVDSVRVIDRDPETGQQIEIETDGQAYSERRVDGADYVTMMAICQHDIKRDKDGWRACCLRQVQAGMPCYGRYRPPDQVDLDTLREDFHNRVLSICRPGEPLTARAKQFLYSYWLLDQLREEAKIDAELDDRRNSRIVELLPWRLKTEWGSKKNHFSIPGL